MTSKYGKEALARVEQYKRSMTGESDAATNTPRSVGRQPWQSRRMNPLGDLNKAFHYTQNTAEKIKPRRGVSVPMPSLYKKKHTLGTFADGPPPRETEQSGGIPMSQMSQLTDYSRSSSSSRMQASQGMQSSQGMLSQRSKRSESIFGGTHSSFPLGQRSLSSAASQHDASSVRSQHFSQTSCSQIMPNQGRVPSLAASKGLGAPLERRNIVSPFSLAIKRPSSLLPTASTPCVTTQPITGTVGYAASPSAMSRMSRAPLRQTTPPFTAATDTHPSPLVASLPSSSQPPLGTPPLLHRNSNPTIKNAHSSAAASAVQPTEYAQKIKEMKDLLEAVQQMNENGNTLLAQLKEKTNESETKLTEINQTVQSLDEKTNALGKAVEDADHRHRKRLKACTKATEKIDAKVDQGIRSIAKERNSSLQSIKTQYASVVVTLQDVGAKIFDRLHHHPVAGMVEKFWSQFRKAKENDKVKSKLARQVHVSLPDGSSLCSSHRRRSPTRHNRAKMQAKTSPLPQASLPTSASRRRRRSPDKEHSSRKRAKVSAKQALLLHDDCAFLS